jgi:hypothetical protein
VNEVKVNVDQQLLNAALAKVLLSGGHEETGKVDLPKPIPDVSWSVAIRYTVSGISGTIETDRIRISADVQVEAAATAAGLSLPFSYTDRVEGTTELNIQGPELLISVTSLNVDVYFQLPKGLGRQSLGTVDVCRFLCEPIVLRFRLLPDSYAVSLPGGQFITLTADNPTLNLLPENIEATLGIRYG